MKKHYLPYKAAQRVVWLNNFNAKLPTYAATLGIGAPELALIALFAAMYAFIIDLLTQVNDFKENVTDYKRRLERAPQPGVTMEAVPVFTPAAAPAPLAAGIFSYIALLVKRIKGHTAYTTSMGQDLGIIGDESTFDPLTAKPVIEGVFTANHVVISFDKPREVDAVRIMSRRPGDSSFTFLADDTNSPYDDYRFNVVVNQPEDREYKAFFVIDTQVIGLESDVIRITVNMNP